jgi:hypothetical protein
MFEIWRRSSPGIWLMIASNGRGIVCGVPCDPGSAVARAGRASRIVRCRLGHGLCGLRGVIAGGDGERLGRLGGVRCLEDGGEP